MARTSRMTLFERFRLQKWNWDTLIKPLDHALERQAPHSLTRESLLGLRYFWLDGLFSAISDNFYGSFLTFFALAYGASNGPIGLLSSIGSLMGALALFPGARMGARPGIRKPLILWTGGGISRIALLAFACLPLLIISPTLAITLIIALNALRAFMSNFAMPPWTALVAELVPDFMRGRYFGHRNIAMGIAALIVAPLSGWLINVGNGGFGIPLFGYQIVFVLAFITGVMSTFSFAGIPEPQSSSAAASQRQANSLWHAIRNSPGFIGMVISAFVWNLGIQIGAPFFSIYLVSDLGGTTATVGWMASISSLFSLAGQQIFGRWLDRKGSLWVQKVTGLLIPIMPFMWMVITKPWHAALINMVGGFLWAGYGLASFNLLLELTPNEQRADAVALYQTVVFVSAVVGPLLGGYLADTAGFKMVFAFSGIGRALGIILFLWLSAGPALRSGKGAPVTHHA